DPLAGCGLARGLLICGPLSPCGLAEKAVEKCDHAIGIPALDCFVQKALSFNAGVGVGLLQPLKPLRMTINFSPIRNRAIERLVDRALGRPHGVLGFDEQIFGAVNKSLDVGRATEGCSALQSLLSWCRAGRAE